MQSRIVVRLRARRRDSIFAIVTAAAFLIGGLMAAPDPASAVDDLAVSPIERLGGCLAGGGVGDVVLLIDESESVQDSDPNDARTTSATYFVNQLGAFAVENDANLSVQVATFAQAYTPITNWIPLDQSGIGVVQGALMSVADRDDGWETDYWSALNGARIALADAAAARGSAASCQSVVWFSDGDLWFNPAPRGNDRKGFAADLIIRGQEAADEARRLAQVDLCRTGGLADQLRSSGVITFGIGLDGPAIRPGGFDLMESIVAGSAESGSATCGSILEPSPGAFFVASDIDSLLFAFDELSTPGQPPITQQRGICQVTVCASEGHRIVLDSSTPRVTILATSDLPGALVSIQTPTGEIVEIPRGTGVLLGAGASVAYEWKSDRSVSIVIDRGASTQWRGLWQLAFTDPAGTSAGQTSQSNIRVQGALIPDWANSEDLALNAGDLVDGVELGFISRTGEDADLTLIEGSLDYSAVFRDSEGTPVTIIRTTDPEDLVSPLVVDLSDAALGAGSVTLQSRITTAATTSEGEAIPGTQLEAETVTIPVTVLPPLQYPVVGSSIDFGHVESEQVELRAVLPVSGDGCIRIPGDLEILASPADVGAVTVTAADSGCLPPSADGIELTLATDNSGNGTINGTLTVVLEPDAAGEPLETTVAFTASLTRPLNAVNFWLTLIVALILGPGLPLGILYLTKWIVSTIPARVLYGFVVDVTVDDSEVLREGQPFAARAEDTASLVSVPPRARKLTVDGIRLKVRTGVSPFGRGQVVVDAPGRSSISSATPAVDRSGLRAVLPLAVHNHWVLLRSPGTPADRAQLLVLLGGNDVATISRFLQTLTDRGPERLRALVAAETAQGAPPSTQGPVDSFAVAASGSEWGGGNPFDAAHNAFPSTGSQPPSPRESTDDGHDKEWKPWV